MDSKHLNILLADDNTDDCSFFAKALEELPQSTQLITMHDGEQLMIYLSDLVSEPGVTPLPDVLFLDLNMPRKNGFECLSDMKQNKILKDIPVVIFSTSNPQNMNYDHDMTSMLLKYGAIEFIRKTDDLDQLKELILQTLNIVAEKIADNS